MDTHFIIRDLYPNVVTLRGTTDATDANGNVVVIDQSAVDAELTRLQTEYDSLAYARSRKQEYDKLNQ